MDNDEKIMSKYTRDINIYCISTFICIAVVFLFTLICYSIVILKIIIVLLLAGWLFRTYPYFKDNNEIIYIEIKDEKH